MRRFAPLALAVVASCSSPALEKEKEPIGSSEQALDTSFAVGSLIIPMDTTYQDTGMLTAFGLVYDLLKKGVPVRWIVKTGKAQGDADFTTTATDFATSVAIPSHGYRGGPFVIDSADVAKATPIVTAWIAAHATTRVHKATAIFTADVRRTLTAAPKIAVFVDGNELIAFTNLNAAGIPDSAGKAWPTVVDATGAYAGSVDVLSDAEIKGAGTGLMNADGTPKYCQLTSMHYAGPGDDTVVKAVRTWLTSGPATHAFMECEAARTFENSASGRFLTTNGIADGGATPAPLTNRHPDSTFAQYDGPLTADTGLLDNIALGPMSAYRASDVVLVNRSGVSTTTNVMWLTGFVDGDSTKGKVSYLAGHNYSTATPISLNAQTNGVRLFLDSLFESGCTAVEGQPVLTFTKAAPATTTASTITFTLNYSNAGPGIADNVVITDPIPAGTTFASASAPGTFAAGVVTWNIGNVKAGGSGSVSLTVNVPANGTYTNTGTLVYNVSLTSKTIKSNTTSTVKTTAGDAGTDASDTGTDTGVADTGVADTGTPDTGVADTGALDTGVVVDTGVLDTGVVDTGVLDTGVDAGGCSTDADCVGTKYCDTPSKTCKDKLPNGTAIPNVPGHTPTVDGTCTTAAGTAVCASGVCDPVDNKCGLANGDGPCTSGTVCRSTTCDSASSTCVGGCTVDTDCDTTVQFCNTPSKLCTGRIPNGSAVPTVAGHSPTLDGKCSSAAATATCVSKVCDTVDDKCGFTDGHTCGADAECRSTDCGAVSKVCLPAGGCKVDGDCAATDYCDTPSSTCKAKLDNGEPIPTVTGHTPAVSGTCTSTAATVVCKSAVCDPVDNKCGLADGDGPCTSSTVCRSDVCSGGVCGAPDGGTDAGEDGGDTGVTDTGMASDSGGEDSSIEVDAASDAETDAETDGATTNADSGTLEGGGCSCTVPHSENESSSNKGLVMVGAALAIAGLRRRRR